MALIDVYYSCIHVLIFYIHIFNISKFIGIWLDSNLNWSVHTKYVANKIARIIGLIWFASISLPIDVLTKMYYTFIYPYLIYALPVWVQLLITMLIQFLFFKTFNTSSFKEKGKDLSHTFVICAKFDLLYVYVE